MNIFHALILGILEGVTEFLPVSSTGHLTLASELLKIQQSEFIKSFEIIIQLGAILAVVVLYFKTLLKKKSMWKNIALAFLPTAIVGLVLYKIIKHYLLGNDLVTLLAIGVGGVLLIILELTYREKDHHVDKIENITNMQAFFIGVCQSLAIIPGISRSAATVIGALFLGVKRKAAVEFSFLLAVPTILAASSLDFVKSQHNFTGSQYELLGVGFLASFVVAVFAMRWLLGFIQKNTFIPFGIYRVALAILFWTFLIRR